MLPLTIFNMVMEGMVAQVAVIRMVTEAMVVDHPTLEQPIPIPEMHMLSVLDVAKITMSWPVQPLLLKEDKLCSNRIGSGHPIGSLILFNLILFNTKSNMVLPTMPNINRYKHLLPHLLNRLH
jgi:hypothetical protein